MQAPQGGRYARGPAKGMPPGGHAGYPPYQAQNAQVVMQQQQRAEDERRQARARMLSRKPTDRDIPAGVDEITIGGAVERYQKLRELERKLDATMMRKRLDLQDQPRDVKRRRTMRIWISNTAENQPWQATGMDNDTFDFGDNSQATYRVKIEGRLLDEEDVLDSDDTRGPDAMETNSDSAEKRPIPGEMTRFSHFFKKITIDFDRPPSLQPDNMAQIEWIKPETREGVVNTSDAANFDCLHFERKSDENINIRINLYPDNQPEIYRLSDELSQICGGIKEDTKANITMSVWKYIRVNKLDGGEDARKARCDPLMKNVFGYDTIELNRVGDAIIQHCKPLPPITLDYTIRVDRDYINATPKPSPYTIYDVSVLQNDPTYDLVKDRIFHSPSTTATLETISRIDTHLALVIQAIAQSKGKHTFFTSMAADPVNFLKRWISSQKRDLEVILGEATRPGVRLPDVSGAADDSTIALSDEWRRGGKESVWGSQTAKESVALFLARGGRDKDGRSVFGMH
ncbi:uncharacterized protein PV09_01647 [Verruconis gallopava]|uniref:DM2 domain-containing protein n=1 Tax=Verruconis gallopava TaxID=253628 RepID=A0A0D2AMK4_9PEZI|nr:uncharacterized protein PV09_01647 [Verruconis gallopava]KIW07715.1 hypothetical protein PV09_01647 [Verruconis gallopava]